MNNMLIVHIVEVGAFYRVHTPAIQLVILDVQFPMVW